MANNRGETFNSFFLSLCASFFVAVPAGSGGEREGGGRDGGTISADKRKSEAARPERNHSVRIGFRCVAARREAEVGTAAAAGGRRWSGGGWRI